VVTAPDTRASDADTVADLPDRGHTVGLLGLFLVSGAAALIYQVLWVRELGLLFGSTAQAAAMAIAIFFAGLASGGWFWGRRVGSSARPLRWFGLLELGIAATALRYFLPVDAYVAAYPALFQLVGDRPALDTVMKALVAATVLLPPAWLMGGTLPVLDSTSFVGASGSPRRGACSTPSTPSAPPSGRWPRGSCSLWRSASAARTCWRC
jgi:hypothetical protein